MPKILASSAQWIGRWVAIVNETIEVGLFSLLSLPRTSDHTACDRQKRTCRQNVRDWGSVEFLSSPFKKAQQIMIQSSGYLLEDTFHEKHTFGLFSKYSPNWTWIWSHELHQLAPKSPQNWVQLKETLSFTDKETAMEVEIILYILWVIIIISHQNPHPPYYPCPYPHRPDQNGDNMIGCRQEGSDGSWRISTFVSCLTTDSLPQSI